MNRVQTSCCARGGLLGNPSDGYHGKCISFSIQDHRATVTLQSSDRLVLESPLNEEVEFDSLHTFLERTHLYGYYGGLRLVKSALLRFLEYCHSVGFTNFRPFKIRWESNIPRHVGLAGSSAIVIATLRGLCRWHQIELFPHWLATLAMQAESRLGIAVGWQDRVIQSLEGVVVMDFTPSAMRRENGIDYGHYQPLRTDRLPQLYVAYSTRVPESTEVVHNDLRRRFDSGDQDVIQKLEQIASLVPQGIVAIEAQDDEKLAHLINLNFDLRQAICQLHPEHVQMVEAARDAGASAKFCGSGGAIVGLCSDRNWPNLANAMGRLDCILFRPTIVNSASDHP